MVLIGKVLEMTVTWSILTGFIILSIVECDRGTYAGSHWLEFNFGVIHNGIVIKKRKVND